jgi:methionyl-tRNA formyltransferase
MRLVFMGTPSHVIPVLSALTAARDVQVVAVYTPPDRPKGRGRQMEMPPVKSFALECGMPVHQPASLRTEPVQAELAEYRPDVMVIAAYGKLLPPPVLNTPTHGCLNLHPSLLPRYRGPSPVATAILEGEETTGVTLMLLDEGMDTGPTISQREYSISARESAESLTATLFQLGAEVLLECLEPWVAGRLTAQPQEDAHATTTRKLERKDGKADWQLPASALERRSRAYSPWPGLFTDWEGKVLKLLDVVPLPITTATQPEPGQVVQLTASDTSDIIVVVGTSEGVLGLNAVQLEGRRAQSVSDFLRGYPHFAGAQL